MSGQQTYKKIFNITHHEGSGNRKDDIRSSVRVAGIQTRNSTPERMLEGCREREPLYATSGMQNGATILEKCVEGPPTVVAKGTRIDPALTGFGGWERGEGAHR